ncbi:MAG: diguanylate cyclase [Gammaproteobacteria bacterium]|nr:diguanylate cyclase [Gammaproteobacteria bacterium]
MPQTTTTPSYDKTVDIVRSAIPRMAELKIPITPSNYAVWFEYLSDSNAGLRREMDALLGREEPISDVEMRDLYERYLEERSEKVASAKTALSRVVNALMQHINAADGHYNSFSAELKDVAEGLSGDVTGDNLNVLIDRAVNATHAALERSAEMKQQFSDLAVEMQTVRSELARTQEEARSDPLTGLYNRLAFQEELSRLGAYETEDSHTPCLMILDIDRFKGVNDTYGHLAGDHVLQAVANEIRASVRGRDVVARYGGEEFAILLRDTARSGCMAVAENVRLHVARSTIQLPPELGVAEPIAVTVSIGGAWFRDGELTEALVDRADRALYRSKEGGRNRVTWES